MIVTQVKGNTICSNFGLATTLGAPEASKIALEKFKTQGRICKKGRQNVGYLSFGQTTANFIKQRIFRLLRLTNAITFGDIGVCQFRSTFTSTFPNNSLEKIPVLQTLFYSFILLLLKILENVIAFLNIRLILAKD